MDPTLPPVRPSLSLFAVCAVRVAKEPPADRTEADGLVAVRAVCRGGDRWAFDVVSCIK
jgi:hypothetical protein